MQVRLRDYDRTLIGTAEAPLARFPLRTFRHDGMLYERIADGADGVWEYRATERTAGPSTQTVDIISADGAELGAVPVPPGPLPESVAFEGVTCPLWTTRDVRGRALYLKLAPDATILPAEDDSADGR